MPRPAPTPTIYWDADANAANNNVGTGAGEAATRADAHVPDARRPSATARADSASRARKAVVGPERDVVLEERRMRVETDPSAQLSEAMAASLFVHHPYGIPIIGWMHEIEALDRPTALAFYKRYYTPNNAILVVSGDVTLDDNRQAISDVFLKEIVKDANGDIMAAFSSRGPNRAVELISPSISAPGVDILAAANGDVGHQTAVSVLM